MRSKDIVQMWDLNKKVSDLEISMIQVALTRAEGSKASAAKLLGIKRTTLVMKMKKYNIPLRSAYGKRS
jgi:sigma-54 specific flagellar transcriptional regulator A